MARPFRWRWAVVTNHTVIVCNMAPPAPASDDPPPPGFRTWTEQVVTVRARHRSRSAAEQHAIVWRRGLNDAGAVGLALEVEVWDRVMVEAIVQPETVTVRQASEEQKDV